MEVDITEFKGVVSKSASLLIPVAEYKSPPIFVFAIESKEFEITI